MVLKPQEGPQEKFMQTEADIAIFGGGAGGGKTYVLLLETLRNINTQGFEAVIFRRTTKMITNPGGLWDESQKIFPGLGARPREGNTLDWSMPDGMTLKFAHMQHESNMYDWQGAQAAFIGWDELTHFTKKQFFYLISRNRSDTGIPAYMRATCNPDADSWVREFIAWWIDPESGLPIPERDGVLRYFIRQGDDIIWGDSREELIEAHGEELGKFAKSVTFIKSLITDNKIFMEKDPSYMGNLNALDRVERSRLRDGNWKIRAASGNYFKRSDFKVIAGRVKYKQIIRYWDRAATAPHEGNTNPDWTVGTLMAKTEDDQYAVFHVERFRGGPEEVERRIKAIATTDGKSVTIGLEQDPGQAGKVEAGYMGKQLAGYSVKIFPVMKDKVTRARGYSAQATLGNVLLVEGDWNEAFMAEHENFPPKGNSVRRKSGDEEETAGKDDQVDSASGAFNFLTGDNVGQWPSSSGQGQNKTTIAPGLKSKDQW